jgi:hypothetical protein
MKRQRLLLFVCFSTGDINVNGGDDTSKCVKIYLYCIVFIVLAHKMSQKVYGCHVLFTTWDLCVVKFTATPVIVSDLTKFACSPLLVAIMPGVAFDARHIENCAETFYFCFCESSAATSPTVYISLECVEKE